MKLRYDIISVQFISSQNVLVSCIAANLEVNEHKEKNMLENQEVKQSIIIPNHAKRTQ